MIYQLLLLLISLLPWRDSSTPGAVAGGPERGLPAGLGQEASFSCMALLVLVSLSMSLSDLAVLGHRCCEGFLSCWAGSRAHRWVSEPTLTSLSLVLPPFFWVDSLFLCPFLSASIHSPSPFPLTPSSLSDVPRPHIRHFKDLGAPRFPLFLWFQELKKPSFQPGSGHGFLAGHQGAGAEAKGGQSQPEPSSSATSQPCGCR